ncbi:hypothetical protein D1614_22730 [Maribellus luteus]|uniref:Uncharacterized protein n=1 Tax=Maribellus luteus TaxID=2305463 RepID=A0A399SRH3_9BACT|nr:hypothetical protein D1614_22730 [Maribellus luteus]
MKDELRRIKASRLQPLIGLLRTKKIEFIDGAEEIPSNKKLAADLGITVTKCNAWLKKLRQELKYSFFRNPLMVNEIECRVLISRHWNEYHDDKGRTIGDENERMFSLDVVLPVIPRMGEEIEFELADRNGYYRGTVHEIIHEVIGKKQRIVIFAHPYENEYERWMRQKVKYEDHKRWLKYRELTKDIQR